MKIPGFSNYEVKSDQKPELVSSEIAAFVVCDGVTLIAHRGVMVTELGLEVKVAVIVGQTRKTADAELNDIDFGKIEWGLGFTAYVLPASSKLLSALIKAALPESFYFPPGVDIDRS